MISRDRLRNPLARARNWGSAKSGTEHFIWQRVTAVALALLTPWFIIFAVRQFGADAALVQAAIARPVNATLLSAFVLCVFRHARLGLQVVVEDYVHGSLELVLQVLIKFTYVLAAIAALLAIGRIAFTA